MHLLIEPRRSAHLTRQNGEKETFDEEKRSSCVRRGKRESYFDSDGVIEQHIYVQFSVPTANNNNHLVFNGFCGACFNCLHNFNFLPRNIALYGLHHTLFTLWLIQRIFENRVVCIILRIPRGIRLSTKKKKATSSREKMWKRETILSTNNDGMNGLAIMFPLFMDIANLKYNEFFFWLFIVNRFECEWSLMNSTQIIDSGYWIAQWWGRITHFQFWIMQEIYRKHDNHYRDKKT